MIVNSKEREITIDGDFKTKEFFIDQKNTVHIVKILRNKLYSDKVLAVMREYITNAIDATVENKSSKPIEISLPTEHDSYFRVRDYGKGLSQKDVENIFISYGNSTKRNSDSFTGCLGIGSKSAFSYAESFIISSFKNGKKTTYMSFLDESGLGSISLISSVPTTDDSGIEICVPVRDNDRSSFHKSFNSYFHAINFPFIVHNSNSEVKAIPVYSNEIGIIRDDYTYFNSDEILVGESYSPITGRYVFMGNVAYKIDNEWFSNHVEDNLISSSALLVFKVKMGEVEFSSNRESIEQTTENAIVLKEYLQRFKEFYESSIKVDFLSNSPNLNFYRKFKLNIKFPVKLIENSNGQLFNLDTFEYELDINKVLNLISSISVKGIFQNDSSYLCRTRNLIPTKSDFEYWQKSNPSTKFRQTDSKLPMIVIGSGNPTKDDEIIAQVRQSMSSNSSNLKVKLRSAYPNCEFMKHLPYTKQSSSAEFPLFFLVQPSNLSEMEFIDEIAKFGFQGIPISFFKQSINNKVLDDYFSMFIPTEDDGEVIEVQFDTKVTKKIIQAELDKFGYSVDDCYFFKNSDTDKYCPIRVKNPSDSEMYFDLYSGNLSDADFMFGLKLFREETGKIPIIFCSTQQSFGINWMSKRAFTRMYHETVLGVFKKMEPQERYYLRKHSLVLDKNSVEINYSEELTSVVNRTGFSKLEFFMESFEQDECMFKTNELIRSSFKNKKLLKTITRIKTALSAYSGKTIIKLDAKRKSFIDELRNLVGQTYIPYYFCSNTVYSNINLDRYIVKLIEKLLRSNPFFFLVTKQIRSQFSECSGYYSRKYVQDKMQINNFKKFVSSSNIGVYNGKA